LSNADLEKMVDTSDEWIVRRVGIRERHIVDPGVATSDLGTEAAGKALAKAGLAPNDIGVIICHGRSSAKAVKNAMRLAAEYSRRRLAEKIQSQIAQLHSRDARAQA